MIVNVILGLIVVIGIYFGYNKFISEPKATEAANQIFGAQNYFEKDSFNLALNGDGNVLGFIEIADKYSSTPSGNLANLYAGLSYLYTNEYDNAIKYLKNSLPTTYYWLIWQLQISEMHTCNSVITKKQPNTIRKPVLLK